MDAKSRLRKLCRRYGLDPEQVSGLLPLLEKAAGAAPERRRWLETVVEAALAARALRRGGDAEGADQQLLLAVAGLLHRWEPDAPPGRS